jgi:hypothetical protein
LKEGLPTIPAVTTLDNPTLSPKVSFPPRLFCRVNLAVLSVTLCLPSIDLPSLLGLCFFALFTASLAASFGLGASFLFAIVFPYRICPLLPSRPPPPPLPPPLATSLTFLLVIGRLLAPGGGGGVTGLRLLLSALALALALPRTSSPFLVEKEPDFLVLAFFAIVSP